MTDQSSLNLQATPDGGAEVHLVLRLSWQDIADLGREAGRLAAQRHRPVSLDEAAVHALRSWSAPGAPPAAAPAAASPAKPRSEAPIASSPSALAIGSSADQTRQAVQHNSGSVPAAASGASSGPAPAAANERPRHAASALDYPTTSVTSLASRLTDQNSSTA